MVQHSLRTLYGVLLLCIASRNPTLAQSAPSSNRPLQIYITASGKDDSPPIPTLSKLSGAIDKQAAQITSVRSANADKMRFALLVDASNSETKQAASISDAAVQLFQGLLEQGNEGYLLVFNEQVITSSKPLQLSEVRQVLESGVRQAHECVKPCGGSAINDAIAFASQKLLNKPGNPETPRRVILLISDGEDNASKIYLGEALDIAIKEGVAIFSLQTGTSEMGSSEARHARLFFEVASLDTGGRTFRPKRVEDGVPLLLEAIHKQWVLEVVPPQVPDQKLHTLSIKSSEKNVQISAPERIVLE
jgi:VWFA-related protein